MSLLVLEAWGRTETPRPPGPSERPKSVKRSESPSLGAPGTAQIGANSRDYAVVPGVVSGVSVVSVVVVSSLGEQPTVATVATPTMRAISISLTNFILQCLLRAQTVTVVCGRGLPDPPLAHQPA